MTVSSTQLNISYTGDGSSTTFTVPFYFLLATDLIVTVTPSGSSTATTLVYNTDYTVANAHNPAGGSITCTVAPALNSTIAIIRKPPLTQLQNIVNNETMTAPVLDDALDKLTMIMQAVQQRAINLQDADPTVGPAQLPLPAARAGTVLAFDPTTGAIITSNPGTLANLNNLLALIAGGPTAAIASQAQAVAGVDNTTLMTPLRTAQAVTADLAASPALGGTPTAPTRANSVLSTAIATTAWVQNATRLLTLEMFGGVADGSTDNTASLTAALAALGANGGRILLGPGVYNFNSQQNITYPATVPYSISIVGAGQDVTRVNFPNAVTNGFNFSLQSPRHSVRLTDFTFTTGVANGGTAVNVFNSVQESNFAQNDFRNLTFCGSDGGQNTFYWAAGISLTGLCGVNIDACTFYGDSGNLHHTGIIFQGYAAGVNKYAIVLNVFKCSFFNNGIGIQLGSYWQGVQIVGSNFTNGTTAILEISSAAGILSQLSITASQFNTYGNQFVFNTGVDQVMLVNNLIYVYQNNAGVLGAQWLGGSIVGNQFTYTGTPRTNQAGVIIGTVSNSQPTTIIGNVFQGQTTAVWLQAASTLVNVQANAYANNTTNVTNSGTGNSVGVATQ